MFKKWICQNKNWVFQNFPFLENDFDALTDYELFCKMVEYAKSLAISNDKFVKDLKANLDTMYNEGKFDSFIEEIINLQTTFTFDSVADMKSATNLINGCYARTSGFYSYNDGGGAYYKVRQFTSADVIDDAVIIALNDNTLIAELIINNVINVKQFGCKGDGIENDTVNMQKAINFAYHLVGSSIYDSYKLYIPKGKYLVSNQLTFNSSSLIGSEHSNIVVSGDGQGSSVIISNFAGDDNTVYITTSSKFTISDLSFKNISANNVNMTAIKISDSSMMINLNNIFIYGYFVGIDGDICVGNITNCFVNCCNCGFKLTGTATTISNCYASQITVKEGNMLYEGCGYYIDNAYSNLLNCASDSNDISYKIVGNGVRMANCGMEGGSKGIVIQTSNSNFYEAPIVIDGYIYANINKPTIEVKMANKVIIKNHNFSLDYDYVKIDDNLPSNVVEYDNCNFQVSNYSLYPNEIPIPLENRSRANGVIYNCDGLRSIGKGRLYQRTLRWRITKTDTLNRLTNGRQASLHLKIRTVQIYADVTNTSINQDFSINYWVSTDYPARSNPYYDNTLFTFNTSDDDNYYYFELEPINTVIPDNNLLCYDIDIIDTNLLSLNTKTHNLIEIEGLDYTI